MKTFIVAAGQPKINLTQVRDFYTDEIKERELNGMFHIVWVMLDGQRINWTFMDGISRKKTLDKLEDKILINIDN